MPDAPAMSRLCPLRERQRASATSSVQILTLEMPGDFRFRPGQYLQVEHPDGPIPLSIASAPWRLPALHLHYLSEPGSPEAARLDALLDSGGALPISGPFGTVGANLPDAPLLIAAGGTGIAQALSFLDAFRNTPRAHPTSLLWCADRPEDLYLDAMLQTLPAGQFHVHPIADPTRGPQNAGMKWLRSTGARAEAVILSGSPGFVYAALDTLLDAGVPRERIESDVFSYAPRA